MTMTWEERCRMLIKALKSNKKFWTPWLAERITEGPVRDFFDFPDKETKAAKDLVEAMNILSLDMKDDPESEPTEV